ncbi:tetratricopeptide repeat protein [bacterium]|nr:tetratricopeptide repeat protein [bacterium]
MTRVRAIAVAVLAIGLFACTIARASGEGAAMLYNQGNAAYAAGDIDGAIERYEQARKQGSDDPRLFYNLGVAHMKNGELGQAIRYFAMARRRAPRDGDATHNLEFARERIADKLPDEDRSIAVRVTRLPLTAFTEGELALAFALLWTAGFAVLAFAWPRRHGEKMRRAIRASIAGVALSLLIAGYAVSHAVDTARSRAVVGIDELAVRSGPSVDDPTLFTIHEGLTLVVREVRGTWSLVAAPTGASGWVPNETLLPIG